MSTQLLKKFEGLEIYDNLGFSVAFVGDVDGDGLPDIVVGAPGASPGGLSGAGSVFLYSGGNFSLINRFDGQSAGEDFGVSVAGIGDLDGDGIPDILIGADFADPGGRTNAGSVYVYSGRSPFSLMRQLEGEAAGDFFGTTVASLGNLTGDGRPEFAVGAISVDPDAQRTDAGRVYVYNGNFTLVTRLDGNAAHDNFGISIAETGDVNGDSIPDILVGADSTDPGSAYLFSGQDFSLLQRFDGESSGDFFGSSVSGASDVNGDGRRDILVGAPGADPANITEAGSAYLFSGATYALLHRFDGTSTGDSLGWRVSAAGDVDGDSFPDVAIAADFANPLGIEDAGSVYLYSGRDYSFLGQANGEAAGDNLGSSIAGAADTDGDGMPDLLAGAPYNSPNSILEAGSAYLYKMTPIPVARFSFNPSKPITGQLVTFDGSGSTSPNGPIVSYSWAFGDGGIESGALVTYAYGLPGSYEVSLTITDSTGDSAVKVQTINVNPVNQSPAASFSFTPSRPVVGNPVTFNASASGDPDGTIVSYSWNFGDGSPTLLEYDPITFHTYSSGGPVTVSLFVTDDDGATGSTNLNIVISASNQPAIVRFTHSPTTPLAGQTVGFDAATSYDPDGAVVSYSWNLGDGSTRSGVTMTYTYSTSATYQVTLTLVDDSDASNSTSQQVQVLPALTVGAFANTTGGIVPLTVEFTAQPFGGQGPYTFLWDFGDGETASGVSAIHRYSSPGSYRAKVTVTDSLGNTALDAITVTVISSQPDLTATASSSTTGGIAPLTVTFTGQASGGASPYTFSWDFGDGQAATGESFTHQYSSPGSYQAELNVTDSLGNTAIDTITITVVAVLPGLAVTTSYEPTGGIAPLTAQFNATASGGQGSYTFIWDFGDGQTSGGAPTSHTYSVAGNYTVRVTVQDGDGNTASDTIVVTVLEQRPPMVGPIPAEYLLYGLVAAIAGVVVLAALYLQRPRPVKPATQELHRQSQLVVSRRH